MKLFILGLIFAKLYSYNLPNEEGDYSKYNFSLTPIIYKGNLIIPISKDKAIHFHHWFVSIFMIYIFKSFPNNYTNFFIGFLIGHIIQGLSYKDRFEFMRNNPYNNSI